jgi:two-component system, NtrC family, nitrogen regulation sensor histidine kinase NtrY
MASVAQPPATIEPSGPRLSVTPAIELAVLGGAIAIGIATYFIITSDPSQPRPLAPPLVALLMVANLVPGVALLVLIGRRIARARAAQSPIGGGGQLHVRLVALFSVLASVPMILVTIIASLLFQYGVEFWFSDRARGMIENASALASESYQRVLNFVDRENVTMAGDLGSALEQVSIDDPDFAGYFAQQVYYRGLSEAVIFSVADNGEVRTMALVNPYDRNLDAEIDREQIARVRGGEASVASFSADRIRSLTQIPGMPLFLLSARVADNEQMGNVTRRAQAVLGDYQALTARSRSLQLQFNIALLAISLLIVALAVFVALAVADRLVRPVSELVDAARRVASGDLDARVTQPRSLDEVGTLASAFNRMTERLSEQTNALVTANAQIDRRRALIEAVMSGVSAGVLSIGRDRRIQLINSSAMALLRTGSETAVGRPLGEIAPELDHLLDGDERDAIVQMTVGGEAKTLAIKVTRDDGGQILTFDDITQQLLDQRRAAWSDVARRIAHEIKNPLTPIQLAAERLQRRYGKQVEAGDTTFARLTETIVRQVGDLRRMVDEFSSFARMPKPVFREESLPDIARQSLFLHEVAHPEIAFAFDSEDDLPPFVCDRRQIGQALTNIIKNAVEAIGAREGEAPPGRIEMHVRREDGRFVRIDLIDNGVGLPVERDRIVEPYVTTRSRGTGLGLAIVKKIVEEHFGTIAFSDAPEGGTQVVMRFDAQLLAQLDERRPDEGEPGDERPMHLTRYRN